MENMVNLKELRENLAKYIKRVEKGESFVVMKRSAPIFRITPVDEPGWETVLDFTHYKKGGVSAEEILEKLKSI